MKRRGLMTAVTGVTLWPCGAREQQAPMPMIGFLCGASANAWAPLVTAFSQGLSEIGYNVGKNVALEFQWADYHYERLPGLAADLVHSQTVVIVATGGPPAIRAAMAATQTIPIVFTIGADPVRQDFVPASVGRAAMPPASPCLPPSSSRNACSCFTNCCQVRSPWPRC